MRVKNIIPKGLNLLCILVVSASFSIGTSAIAATLVLNDQWGEKGDTVTYSVSVNAAPNEVAALGFVVRYDPRVLNYRGHTADYLVNSFDFFNTHNAAPGIVKVGGFVAGEGKIYQDESGMLVSLTFEVVGHNDCQVWITQRKDDIATWSTQPGHFTGDHAVEQESFENPESTLPDASINDTETETKNNRTADFAKPAYSNSSMVESSPASSGDEFRVIGAESTQAQPHAVKPREAGFSRRKGKAATQKDNRGLFIAGKAGRETNPTRAKADKSSANSGSAPQALPINNPYREEVKILYSGKTGSDGWSALIELMTFFALTFYLTLACAIVLVGYIAWEFFKKTGRRLGEA